MTAIMTERRSRSRRDLLDRGSSRTGGATLLRANQKSPLVISFPRLTCFRQDSFPTGIPCIKISRIYIYITGEFIEPNIRSNILFIKRYRVSCRGRKRLVLEDESESVRGYTSTHFVPSALPGLVFTFRA